MRNLLFILFVCLLGYSCDDSDISHAENSSLKYLKDDFEFMDFDDSGNIKLDKETGKPFTGILIRFQPEVDSQYQGRGDFEGIPTEHIWQIETLKDGIRDGVFIKYYSKQDNVYSAEKKGKPLRGGEYLEGRQIKAFSYHLNGNIREERIFDQQMNQIEVVRYDKSGNKIN